MKVAPFTVSLAQVLIASPTQPMTPRQRRLQLTKMWAGLAAIETQPDAGAHEYRNVADAVNLLETLREMGHAVDRSGLLDDASAALHAAVQRYQHHGTMRLDGPGLMAVRGALEDYAAAVETLPARVILIAHRETERRQREVLRGISRAGDALVVLC